MKKVIAGLIALTVAGCTDPRAATNALDNLGMKDITITGYDFWGECGETYTYQTGFTARNQNGKLVTGVVCSTYWGTSTVKFY